MRRGPKKRLFFDCPDCGSDTDIKPTSQRNIAGGRVRYRICPACEAYFTTLDKGDGERYRHHVETATDDDDDFLEDPELLAELDSFWSKLNGR